MVENVLRNFVAAAIVIMAVVLPFSIAIPRSAPAISTAAFARIESARADAAAIDRHLHRDWQARGIRPAATAEAATVARRMSLALAGSVPSLEDLRRLDEQPEPLQLAWWSSRLLDDRRTADYLAERMARVLVGTEDGPFLVYRRRRFVTWLADAIHSNRPYDEIVRELITATGLWTDSPAVNFLTVTLSENRDGRADPERLAARTSRAFLGMRIDCLQCHDDHLGTTNFGDPDALRPGTQADFQRLAAFYSTARTSLLGLRDDRQDYRYKFLGEEEESTVEPDVPFYRELLEPAETPRRQLAAWVTHPENRAFARATVNRVWGLLFGKPLVDPVDDLQPFDVPESLDALAEVFVASGYDLKHLIRVIVMTEAFSRDSKADFEITAEHETAFAVFPLTPLRPEQVAGSLIQATTMTTLDADSHILKQLIRYGQQNDFVRRYGDSGDDEFDLSGGTVTQRLLMMNGKLIRERLRDNRLFGAATRIAMLAPSDESAVETAYLCVLSRRPSADELDGFISDLRGTRRGKRVEAVEDLFWVLFNSTEFSWNH